MKHVLFLSTFILLLFPGHIYSQITDYKGTWKFEAPDAPQETANGTIIFTADSAITIFNTGERFKSSWLKVKNDSILFESQINDGVVQVSLKMNDNNSMTGTANWGIGESSLILKKQD
jgi:hypothetical protein